MGREADQRVQEQTVQDGVPQTRPDRDRLRAVIRRYVAERNPVPPLGFSELLGHVQNVLKAANLDAKYDHYAAVLIHNETWRESLAAVPFDRRLLLLPLCLRDRRRCRGQIDELGLVCGHCGPCAINELTTDAERLGYVVLVAEGTAPVISLIESGKIEAVVGVSCLSALEQVYPLMEAAAVPAVAVPLLRDGCADTAVDLDWVREAMHLCGAEPASAVPVDDLRRRVQSWFTPAALDEVLGPVGSETESVARDWLAVAGKRWRPLLAACVFEALRRNLGAGLPADLRRLAVAVECFHKASLVHDDIEDSDAIRYGQKTVHERYGVPIALNVGDLLLGEGYRCIAESGVDPARKVELLKAAAAAHRELCIGQGAELHWRRGPGPLSVDAVKGIYLRKTAPAFEVAMHFGAILAGAGPDVLEVLRDYACHLGIAYQIGDDLADFRGEPGPSDGRELHPSMVTALAYETARGDTKRMLRSAWAGPLTPEALAALMDRIGDLGTEAARRLLQRHRSLAIDALAPLKHSALKRLLRQVLEKILPRDTIEVPGGSETETTPGRGKGGGPAV
ncbi:MAG TPA: polyprenyl synthetase family protein [Phycisphaerae bacterium]|nr:polyprenyl synthetase family protein [Phycisphaerae bacterium]HUU60419.1 polyprenyl synthetase family protein [Phycisphaerae bacterium]